MIHIKNIHRRMEADARKILDAGALNSHEIIATWRELATSSVPADPLFASHAAAAEFTEHSHTFKAFVHEIENHGFRTHFFKEFKAGDIIIDYPASEGGFQGKQNIRFQYKGAAYVPKVVGREVTDAWDTSQGNTGIRSLFLTLQQ